MNSYHIVHAQFECWFSWLTPTRLRFHAKLLIKFTLYLTTIAQRNGKTKIRPCKAISELNDLLHSTFKTVYHHFPKHSSDAAAVNVWETFTAIQMPISFPTLLPPSLLKPRNNEGIALLRVVIMLDFLKDAEWFQVVNQTHFHLTLANFLSTKHVSLSLSLSLSHTHTHTHILRA
jgi:hypothetical protein